MFFLTLPPELQLACVEKLSLHRVRDSMGLGLEPVIGLLRYSIPVVLTFEDDICMLESPKICFTSLIQITTMFFNSAFPLLGKFNDVTSSLFPRSSPLPFYALSNLLTLFAHDMPTLPLIQHVFDYLLCRPPIAAVYLAVAVSHIHLYSL